MSDFGPSGIYGLPPLTIDSLRDSGDPRVLGWIREAVVEGDRLNRSDPTYDKIEIGQRYVSGDQRANAANLSEGPAYLPGIQLNESRRVVESHVSALTDLKPLFAYKATNPQFALAADMLNKLTIAWWITSMADIELGYVIKYALAGGTGDCVTEWNPSFGFGGDCQISARDPRDTLPIRPATHSRSLQDWEGLILRESHTVNTLRGLYPTKAHLFRPTTDSLLSTLMGKFRQVAARIMSPANDTLSGLNQPALASRVRSGECLLYRVYLTDRSTNLTTSDIPMGTPGASWAYVVRPGQRLYPHRRLIVGTPEALLYDGPNPYWHGQYPVSRLKLWDLPWQFLGMGLLNDLAPIQDAINQFSQDILLGLRKWLDPSVQYNRGAVSENFMRTFDPRRPGAKIKLNTDGMKEGFKVLEGPPPAILSLGLEALNWMTNKFNDLSGTPNLQQLLALRQIPGAETIQKYWEALTPELRQEGRMVEAFLRDVAEQLKVLRFQYESNARRVTILGDAGLTLQDFDFDPDVMVPALKPDDPGYQKEFDYRLARDVRAKTFHKAIVFTIAPNSVLSMNATEQKLIRLQLARAGMYDFWSLLESLEIPNVGQPPAIPLPPLNPESLDPAQVLQSLAANEGKYLLDPTSGQLMEVRVPLTITERLIAQQQLQIGMVANPAGRKATAQAAPQVEQKGDGRTTVTESRHTTGPNG